MTARGTDWGLAGLVCALAVTGALTLFAGARADAWVFDVHDVLGFAIFVLVGFKLRRVWPRLANPARMDRAAAAGIAGAVLVAGGLLSGWLWAGGASPDLAGYSLLTIHEMLGAALVVVVALHMALRARPLRRRHLAQRRQFLVLTALGAGSLLAFQAQRPIEALLSLRGARRRFTGSYEAGSFTGNAFPTTSWVADHPRPVSPAGYRLTVRGLVERELAMSLVELVPIDELVATLDCTGGFYSTQGWRGIRLGRLLEQAIVEPRAHHVRVQSRTGYRWTFALQDARALLLATHLGGEPISHDHGAPVRLVVPGARGFQWVKWVERIELLELPDYGAPASTVWSSFTAAGRGAT